MSLESATLLQPNQALLLQQYVEQNTVKSDIGVVKESFMEFVREAWHVIEPSTVYEHNWHIELISEHLQEVYEGNIKRLIVNIPPRYMKSLLVSVFWPAWAWLSNPWLKWIFCSYSATLSSDHSEKRRMLISSSWYQKIGGNKARLARNTTTEFRNVVGGEMIATSVGGSIIGRGGNIIVMDDAMDPSMAFSDAERTRALRWIDQGLMNRLNNKKKDKIVIVMHRLHDDDPVGHAESQSKDWVKLAVPNPATETVIYNMPKSKKKIIYKADDLLWPEREGAKEIADQRVILGPWAFAAQYQQSPTPLGGGILKKDWFRYYEQSDLPSVMMMVVASWDLTFKKIGVSDVCGQAWGVSEIKRFLLDQVKKKMSFLETLQAIQDLNNVWNPDATLVEDKANGPAILNVLEGKIAGLVAIQPNGSKEERCHAISGKVEAGDVYLPKDAHWVSEFVKNVCGFPATTLTDEMDSMTQAIQYCSGMGEARVAVEDILTMPSHASGLSW